MWDISLRRSARPQVVARFPASPLCSEVLCMVYCDTMLSECCFITAGNDCTLRVRVVRWCGHRGRHLRRRRRRRGGVVVVVIIVAVVS